MRDIKFRAWDKVRKEYLSGGKILISVEPSKRPKHSYIFLDILTAPDMYRSRFVIEQYTGLCDKNGKEIYEGDIIQVKLSAGYGECYAWEKFKITFIDGNQLGRFMAIDKHGVSWNIDNSNEIEVIGNIYENSELIKG